MNWEKFKDHFHESWWDVVRPFIESNECDQIYAFLKEKSMERKKIAPSSDLTFRAFKETPLTKMKVCMIGMAPYHTTYYGKLIADGLLMGCSVTGKLQPSLQKFYDGLEKELFHGLNLQYTKTPDVSYLAHQGVFMFNASLTVEVDKAGSHIPIWEPFIKHIFEFGIGPMKVPTIFLGKEAARYKRWMPPLSWSFILSHPASAAYNQSDWDTEKVFTKVNKLLVDDGKKKIEWLKTDMDLDQQFQEQYDKLPF